MIKGASPDEQELGSTESCQLRFDEYIVCEQQVRTLSRVNGL